MNLLQNPAYIISILLILVVASEYLAKTKIFRKIGSSIIVILFGAILANLGVIPSSGNAPPVYSRIFEYAAPLGIFFLLLDVKLKDLKLAGLPMLSMFIVGSLATMAGAVIGYFLFSSRVSTIPNAFAVAGMYTGTYTGGSANLNAVALNYGMMNNGVEFAAINVVDNIVGTSWIMVTLILPTILQKFVPRKRTIPKSMEGLSEEEIRSRILNVKQEIDLTDLSMLLGLGFGTLFISNLINTYFPGIPSILVLTTLALVFAQFPFIQKLKGNSILGFLLILLFLAVIGAFCDLKALSNSGEMAGTLLLWVSTLIIIHGSIIFLVGGIFRQDWDIISTASNANVGGTATAAVCANSLGRPDLQLPGLLVGSLGNAVGTYLGIIVAEILK